LIMNRHLKKPEINSVLEAGMKEQVGFPEF
jgi:hypothetical protein